MTASSTEEHPGATARMKRLSIATAHGRVSASLAVPKVAPAATLVLGHGAGGDRTQESLVALQRALAPLAVQSLVFNFPYAEQGRRLPDRMPVLEGAFAAVLERARDLAKGAPLLAGGRSMGGRVASHLAARGVALDGLVLLGYPLRAAADPKKLRVEHLGQIACPVLFISGTKDALAPRALLARHTKRLGARAAIRWIAGADHGLDLPKSAGRDRADVARECAQTIREWLGERVAARQGE